MRKMRPAAYKLKIEDLVRGQYVHSLEGAEPSHVLTPWGQRVTRARVMGTVVDKFVREDQSYATLRLDDGSETISIRAWREGVPELDLFDVGSVIDVMGKVREFDGEVYLVPELILRVEDPNWELVRELEITDTRREALEAGVLPRETPATTMEPTRLRAGLTQPSQTAGTILEEEESPLPDVPDDVKKRIALALEKLDRGDGATPADISVELNLPNAQVEDALRVLLIGGDIFEPVAGRFKLTR